MDKKKHKEIFGIVLAILDFAKKQNYEINDFQNAIIQCTEIFFSEMPEIKRNEAIEIFKQDIKTHERLKAFYEAQKEAG